MKLRYLFASAPVGAKIVAVAVGKDASRYHGMVEMNETGAFLFNKLKKEISQEGLVQALLDEYEVTPQQAAEDVRAFLALLEQKGVLEN